MSKHKKNKTPKVPDTIDPNEIKTRDELLVQLINGATKGGVQENEKKKEDRKKCRKKVRREEYED